ncbi:MAG: hypothetical protein AAF196_00665 [Planctomycetota bacterium]
MTISSPLFTPLDALPGDDRRLSFGDLSDEERLADWINSPIVSLSEARYSGTELALVAELAGTAVSGTETVTEALQNGELEQTLDRNQERTFETPDVPESTNGSQLTAPSSVASALQTLLERSDNSYRLSPDQVASLVAAYKTYMVNLEEYFNVEGIDYDTGHLGDYVPYKVHFTVSAEPGYYTRYHQYDAIAELTLGENANDVRVLTVSPLETSQTLDQFRATFDSFKSTLEASGQGGPAAARGSIKRINELARRLEGLRENKTLIVGFPAANQIRVRFRPSVVPTDEEQDLQPRSRVLTAIVLVRNDSGTGHALAAGNTSVSTPPETGNSRDAADLATRLSRQLGSLRFEQFAADDTRIVRAAFQETSSSGAVEVEPTELLELDPAELESLRNLDWPSAAITNTIDEFLVARTSGGSSIPTLATARSVDEKQLSVSQECYFAPGLRDQAGDFSPPRGIPGTESFLRWALTKPVDRLSTCNTAVSHQVTVPIWRGRWSQPLRIDRAFGQYHVNAAEFVGLEGTRMGMVRNGLEELKDGDSIEPFLALDTRFNERVETVKEAITALADSTATVGVRVQGPPGVLLETKDEATLPFATWTWARLHGIGSSPSSWRRIGSGSGDVVLDLQSIDVSDSVRVDQDGVVTFGEINAFIEVVMADNGVAPNQDGAMDAFAAFDNRIRQRRVQEFALQPRFSFATADARAAVMSSMRSTSTGSPSTTPSSTNRNNNRVQLDLNSVQIELGGERAGQNGNNQSPPTPTPNDGASATRGNTSAGS